MHWSVFFYYGAGLFIGMSMGIPLGRLTRDLSSMSQIAMSLACWSAAAVCVSIYMLNRPSA